MPQQFFDFSFLGTPADYSGDRTEMVVTLSYTPIELQDAFNFNFAPYSTWSAISMKTSLLAKRLSPKAIIAYNAESMFPLVGVRSVIHEGHIANKISVAHRRVKQEASLLITIPILATSLRYNAIQGDNETLLGQHHNRLSIAPNSLVVANAINHHAITVKDIKISTNTIQHDADIQNKYPLVSTMSAKSAMTEKVQTFLDKTKFPAYTERVQTFLDKNAKEAHTEKMQVFGDKVPFSAHVEIMQIMAIKNRSVMHIEESRVLATKEIHFAYLNKARIDANLSMFDAIEMNLDKTASI